MRILRIVLQLIIAIFFVITLIALLQPSFSFYAFVVVVGFFAFLFSLTLLLREHTEGRFNPSRITNTKVLGSFLVFPGVGSIWFAWDIVTGQQVGSQRISTIIEFVGPWIPAAVCLAMGLRLLWLSYCVYKTPH